jgi:glycosyltransferase involved in cell wall biosynthesis
MKIVIISAAAPPEPIVAGRVHWDLANFLAKEHNEVWLISPFPSRPLGKKYPRYKKNMVTEVIDNFVHVNVNSFTYPKYNLIKRTFESFDFGLKSIRYVNREIKNYDLLYVSSWPFIGQLMILILRKRKKAPLIMNVQDLYPESFFTKINSRFLNWVLKPMLVVDKFIARKSNHITVVSETLKKVYLTKRKIKESKITTIYNWQDESEFVKPIASKEHLFEKYNLERLKDRFIFMYLGNIGPVAGVEHIINAYSGLKCNDTALVIAGSGTQKEKCVSLATKKGIDDIHFVDVPLGLSPVVELQSISDVLLLPIHPEAADSSIPSKLIAYMFSAKPVITSANPYSETARSIKESGCGWITNSNDILDWTSIMRTAYEEDKIILKAKGSNGFNYAIENYSKKGGLNKINQLFTKLINQ